MKKIWAQIKYLSALLRQELSGLAHVQITDRGENLSGIVCFQVKGLNPIEVKIRLADHGINVSVGGQQATPLYMDNLGQKAVLRASCIIITRQQKSRRLSVRLHKLTSLWLPKITNALNFLPHD